jgi:ribonuclease HI
MELIAFEQALVTLESIPLILEVDSQYTINAVTKWHHGWRRNGWRNSKGDPVANRESIERILEVLARRNLAGVHTDIRWVRGHSGSQRNEEADRLARECAEKARILGKAIRLRAGNP